MAKTRKQPKLTATHARRVDVTRAEFHSLRETMVEVLDSITRLREDVGVQFTRIAQIQAEVDRLRAAGSRAKVK